MYRFFIKNKQFESDASPLDELCDCYACKNHSKAYIRHLFRCQEGTSAALMSIHNIFGIPFRIVSCSGEAVSQFYKPLQESPLSDLCATMDGGDPTNVAQIIFKNE